MLKKISLFPVLCLILTGSYAQAPKYSNEFLSIGVGARALSMANAQVAVVSDATAGFWNPSGLLAIKSNLQLALMHSEYFAGIVKYDYGSIAAPIDATSTAGFSLIRFGIDDIPDTSELIDANGNIDYEKIKSFSAVDYGFLFSYARKLKLLEGLNYGVNAKIIHRKIGEFGNAWGFGLDFGAQYELKNWKFGFMGKDITSTFNAWSFNLSDELKKTFALTGNELPQNSLEITLPRFQFGIARKIDFKKFSLLSEIDMDITSDGKRNVLIAAHTFSADPHMGIELGYADLVFLRAGLGNIQKIKDFDNTQTTIAQPSIGVGIKLKKLTVDYALTNIGSESKSYSNVFSLKLDIYKNSK
jgi:hypothetical protein